MDCEDRDKYSRRGKHLFDDLLLQHPHLGLELADVQRAS